MQKLELLPQFIKLYGNKINPNLLSIKYCQTPETAMVEMLFSTNPTLPITTNLNFITGDIITNDDGNEKDLPYFDPDTDIVDNASNFINFGNYSLINCIDNLFTKAAEEEISNEHFKNNPNYRSI
ncbi:MAG: hypothetical protein ACOYN4_13855 [Bacteroidales bacterium]